jgi:hypothetical protein
MLVGKVMDLNGLALPAALTVTVGSLKDQLPLALPLG